MKKIVNWMLTAILLCGAVSAQAQVMKAADLEKYAKQKYGDKWTEAAANLAKDLKQTTNCYKYTSCILRRFSVSLSPIFRANIRKSRAEYICQAFSKASN